MHGRTNAHKRERTTHKPHTHTAVHTAVSWKAYTVQSQPSSTAPAAAAAEDDVRPPDEAYTENLLGGDDDAWGGPHGWLEAAAHQDEAEARAARSIVGIILYLRCAEVGGDYQPSLGCKQYCAPRHITRPLSLHIETTISNYS